MTGHADIRVGFGCDTHRLVALDHPNSVRICGVDVEAGYRVDAHSDGDVGLHALVDAMLGACGLGDIGEHFPPTDPQYRNQDSQYFVERALAMVKSRGGSIINTDITVVSQTIHLGSLKFAMRQNVAHILNLDVARVNIKAKTAERMGALGRGEGLGAYAVVSVRVDVG
jgi:2-C-methyl-D-erythritol 2,4-cyclodiphosphate synthase